MVLKGFKNYKCCKYTRVSGIKVEKGYTRVSGIKVEKGLRRKKDVNIFEGMYQQ